VIAGLYRQQISADITTTAFDMGLDKQAAIIGVMTGITESNLDPAALDALQGPDTPGPLKSVGIYQQKPFYWANEYWPAGTTINSPAFESQTYLDKAVTQLKTTDYAAKKFFAAFNTEPTLKNGAWKKLDPWVVAQTIQKSDFSDGSNYKVQYQVGKDTVTALMKQYPELAKGKTVTMDTAITDGTQAIDNCKMDLGNLDGSYILKVNHALTYHDAGVVFADTGLAVARAQSYVGHAERACSDGMCLSKCDYLAGYIWGYSNSGYFSAKIHWQTAVSEGIAHPGDRNPPIGALLFWDTGIYGHVATYVGNGMVVSNVTIARSADGSSGQGNVYMMPADWWTDRAHYYGWAPPKFRGARVPNAGFTN
jgi:hypothetical protein